MLIIDDLKVIKFIPLNKRWKMYTLVLVWLYLAKNGQNKTLLELFVAHCLNGQKINALIQPSSIKLQKHRIQQNIAALEKMIRKSKTHLMSVGKWKSEIKALCCKTAVISLSFRIHKYGSRISSARKGLKKQSHGLFSFHVLL